MPHNAPPHTMDKSALRKAMLARRSALAPGEVRAASLRAAVLVETLGAWRQAREVLIYLAFGGEVETTALLDALFGRGVRVLAPRCRPGQAGLLDVACLTCLSQLAPGAYGIPEPHPELCPALDDFSPGAALIPAVAFDRRGGRLGFGQGYYDRLLAGPEFEKTFLIGLAHGFQVVDALPVDPWDRPVHVVVTDEDIFRA